MRAGGGRGETLVPLAGAGVTVACLQEGALQFADVGLVLAQLRGRIRVLDQQTTNTQEEVRGGAGRGGGRRSPQKRAMHVVQGGGRGGDRKQSTPSADDGSTAFYGCHLLGPGRKGKLLKKKSAVRTNS